MRSKIIATACAVFTIAGTSASAQPMDIMTMADGDGNGEVTLDEWTTFSTEGWDYISQGEEKVKVADLDQFAQMAFSGIEPDADGYVSRQMYLDAIPTRFEWIDRDASGTLSASELTIQTG